jgi:anti-sigma factor RsiW
MASMNERDYQVLREASWRRPLSSEEEARLQSHLAAHPEAQADWEADAQLTHLLGQLPEAPLASNFTAQVLEAADRAAAAQRSDWRGWWARWARLPLPRLAWAAAFLALAFLGYRQFHSPPEDPVKQAILGTYAAGLPEPDLLQDFDAIQRLSQMPPPADENLWLVLYQDQ